MAKAKRSLKKVIGVKNSSRILISSDSPVVSKGYRYNSDRTADVPSIYENILREPSSSRVRAKRKKKTTL